MSNQLKFSIDVSIHINGDNIGAGDIQLDRAASPGITVNGSGDFHGEELAVTDAEIKALHSSAEITIGRIRGTSVEKLGKNSVLKVGQRGE